nr:nicotinamide-nucleotide amidase [Methylogaea oryzae]
MPDDAALSALAERVGDLLKSHGHYAAVAESCTGGWLAKCLTDVAGSSGWFERGFVSYSNESKQELLGVTEATLKTHGAVSAETVGEMAQGVLSHSRAQAAVAVSGIAGPSGGTADKPVGTVWFAWRRSDGAAACRCEVFHGDREAVRRQAVAVALAGLAELYGSRPT